MNAVFKLIALRPLKGCKDYILKCLSEDTTYYFSNDYEISNDGETVSFVNSNLKPLANDFFGPPKVTSSGPLINISAIVGKNGYGKSSIIELAMRLINNCALEYKFNASRHTLLKVSGVRAALYYRLNNDIYCLKEDDSGVSVFYIGNVVCKDDKNEIEARNEKLEIDEIKKHFFYTMISNYSHYAYNIYDFDQEWDPNVLDEDDNEKCWLFKIFHKNDGYQTPLVLHPYRNKGNININTEKYLSNQRLLSLFINADNPRYNLSSFRNINDQYADLLQLKDPGESKLQEITLKRFLREAEGNRILDGVIENIKKTLQTINEEEGKHPAELHDRYIDIENAVINPLQEVWKKTIAPNRHIFDSILKKGWVRKQESIEESNTDLAELLKILHSAIILLKDDKFPVIDISDEDKLNLIHKTDDIFNNFSQNKIYSFNLVQIQRIDLVDHICDIWRGNDVSISPDNKFDLTVRTIVKPYSELTFLERAHHYIVYKTIQILDRYPNYDKACFSFNNLALSFESESILKQATINLNASFSTLYNDIIEEKSHITLKLRQTLRFKNEVVKNENLYQELEEETFNNNDKLKDSELFDDKNSIIINFEILKEYYNKEVIDIEFLPPPIFQSDIYLWNKASNCYTSLAVLSSGEKQMLNSISAIVYHLQNIDSVPSNSGLTKYEYVNLILEEIELYFHPEYQRSFIGSLLNLIYSTRFSYVKGINIILVTHSPFILSDIPKTNVLFLEHGVPTYEMQENTFGANIHSLLKNGFFLDTLPIGKFAHSKINMMFAKLNTGDFSDDEFVKMYQDILLVGEPYLRKQLLSLYNGYKIPISSEKYQPYLSEVAKLEAEINNIKQKIEEVKNDRPKPQETI